MLSQSAQQQMVDALPIGAAIFTGAQHTISAVNYPMLSIWSKGLEVIGRDLHDAIPEIKDQGFFELLTNVYTTGRPYRNPNGTATILVDGRPEQRFFDFSFQPLKNERGEIYGIVNTAVDTTEQHAGQQAIELLNQELREKEASLRLSVEAARLGTFNLNLATGKVNVNQYCREMFGFPEQGEVTVDDGFGVIADDRERVQTAMYSAISLGTPFETEYRIARKTDDALRWVRVNGKATQDTEGKATHFYGTAVDITEQKMTEQRKSDFIGIVSHEMRSPLTALKGFLQIMQLKAKKIEDQSITTLIERANRQTERMQSLIKGFLDVARIGEGKLQLNLTSFDMADLVKLAEKESLATHTTHHIVFHPVEYTPVRADQDKIEQVLVNFVNNAVKYSPQGSTIHVKCVTKNERAHVSVGDEGMGISAQDLPHVFDRFYRVESQATRNIKGFGIGLYICKEIIELHKGNIGAGSEPGQGSTFWFDLPVEQR